MKIFYKKEFLKISGELEELNNKLEFYRNYTEELDTDVDTLKAKLRIKNSSIGGYIKQINKLKNEIIENALKIEVLNKKVVKSNAAKGGFTKQINKLKEEIKELSAKIKEKDELLSKRYILKKISSGRTPNTIKTSIRSSQNESRAIKYVKEKL